MQVSYIRGIAKLHIMEAVAEHTGEYKIEAVNDFGEASQTCEITVMSE